MKSLTGNFITVMLLTIALLSCNSRGKHDHQSDLSHTVDILQSELDSVTTAHTVPGITLSVHYSNGDSILISSGYADIESGVKMTPDARMFAGSVGKTFVSALVLRLSEEGLIDIRSRAKEYLGDEEWFNSLPGSGEMTVEMLLNHTAGVPEYCYKDTLWSLMETNPDRIWTASDRLACISGEESVNSPGKGWSYADSHYIILGAVIEKVTGEDYYTVLNDMILKPCGLTATTPAVNRIIPGLATGYTSLPDQFHIPARTVKGGVYAFNPQMEWTGGGLVSSVSDLTRWASLLYGGKLLKPSTKELMLTPAPFATTLFENAGYGLGCFVGMTEGVTYYGHTGFFPGYITFVQYLPEYGISIAMQFNDDRSHNETYMKVFFNKLKSDILSNLPANKRSAL